MNVSGNTTPQRCRWPYLAASGLAWATFGMLWWAVRHGGPAFDRPLLALLHRHTAPVPDQLAVFLAIVGNTGPMVGAGLLVLAGLLVRRQRRAAWAAWAFGLSVGGSMVLTQVIKALVLRPRPDLWPSIRPEHTYSFPSGHAMDTAAIATAVAFLAWQFRGRWRWLAWALGPLFVLGVGWARAYLGVHYPSDVLAGWAAAVGWVVLAQGLANPRLVR